ncbi:hypothetical protein TIFTF001_056377 [Ficus carica]|uniref:Uncharacterized protein n=2 Tax=Ficus carica TaxID=3494 RepID=A0AA88EJC6_FICCA|nr:hypothetical protein TIFTF001_056377 [Ficus carica]
MGQNLHSMKPQRTKAELLYDIVVTTGNVEAIKALFREGASLERGKKFPDGGVHESQVN